MNEDKIINAVISDIENKINDEKIAIENIESCNFSKRPSRSKIDMIVIHATMTNRISDIIEHFCNPKSGVSTHFLIGRDGRIVQLVHESKVAWHVGKSYFNGKKDLSKSSIGIHLVGDIDVDFTNEQYSSCAEICANMMDKYGIKPEQIVGCEHVAGVEAFELGLIKNEFDIQKTPGPKFNWKKLHDRYTMKFTDSEHSVSFDEKEPDVYEDDTNKNRMYSPQILPRPVYKSSSLISWLWSILNTWR